MGLAIIGAVCDWGRLLLGLLLGPLVPRAVLSAVIGAVSRGSVPLSAGRGFVLTNAGICEKSTARTPGFPPPLPPFGIPSIPAETFGATDGGTAGRTRCRSVLLAPPPPGPAPPPRSTPASSARRGLTAENPTENRRHRDRPERLPPAADPPKNGRVRREPLTGTAEADGGRGPRGDGGCEGLARRRFLPRAADKMAAAGSAPRSAPPRAPHSAPRPAPTAQPRGPPYANGVAIGRAARPPRPLTPLRRCTNGAEGGLRS